MSAKTHPVPSLKQSFQRMLQAAGDRAPELRHSVILITVASVVEGLAFACFYPLSSALLDPSSGMGHALWIWSGAMIFLMATDAVIRWVGMKFTYGASFADMNYDLRLRLGQQLRRMPLEKLAQRRAGDLGAVLSGNVEESLAPSGNLNGVLIRILVVPVVAVIATFAINWIMAVSMAALFVLAMPVYYWRRRGNGRGMHALASAHAAAESDILEYIQGLPVLRATSQTGRQAEKFQASVNHLRAIQKRGSVKGVWPSLAFSSLAEIGLLALLGLGVYLVLNGETSIAALAALLVIATRFTEPLSLFASLAGIFDYMEAGFTRIQALLAVQPLIVHEPRSRAAQFDIRFNNVTFGYAEATDQDNTALHDVTFCLPEHSLTALVGPSGSGKTTVTKLIMRYADPQSGHIEIGGVDIRCMQPDDLMKHISVVFQDVYLFNESILENIRMGNPEASDTEVKTAAREANCHEFVSRLPEGYDTNVGDIGGSLSGGERQRISIARAVLKDAPIVILDEPTAALDTESELAVQKAIDTLVADRTVIVIAHRLSTIVGANQILVLDEGGLVEQGTHESLMKGKGRYMAMWNAQQSVKSWHDHDNELH